MAKLNIYDLPTKLVQELKKQGIKGPPRVKNAKKVKLDGILFDSIAESKRYEELKILQLAGGISDLKVHPRYPIFINQTKVCEYEGDFSYFEPNSPLEICEDVKGLRTDVYKLKIRIARASYRDIVEFRETKACKKQRLRR